MKQLSGKVKLTPQDKKLIKKHYRYKCSQCGMVRDKGSHIHHLSYDKNRLNDYNNYRLCCSNVCHRKFDHSDVQRPYTTIEVNKEQLIVLYELQKQLGINPHVNNIDKMFDTLLEGFRNKNKRIKHLEAIHKEELLRQQNEHQRLETKLNWINNTVKQW